VNRQAKRAAENSRARPAAVTEAEEVMEMKRRLAELEEVVSRMAPKWTPRRKKGTPSVT
jgi:tetrahydromethanopterin S-methyltransferase subunit G